MILLLQGLIRMFGQPGTLELILRLMPVTVHAVAARRTKFLSRASFAMMGTCGAIVEEADAGRVLGLGGCGGGCLHISRVRIEWSLHADLRNTFVIGAVYAGWAPAGKAGGGAIEARLSPQRVQIRGRSTPKRLTAVRPASHATQGRARVAAPSGHSVHVVVGPRLANTRGRRLGRVRSRNGGNAATGGRLRDRSFGLVQGDVGRDVLGDLTAVGEEGSSVVGLLSRRGVGSNVISHAVCLFWQLIVAGVLHAFLAHLGGQSDAGRAFALVAGVGGEVARHVRPAVSVHTRGIIQRRAGGGFAVWGWVGLADRAWWDVRRVLLAGGGTPGAWRDRGLRHGCRRRRSINEAR